MLFVFCCTVAVLRGSLFGSTCQSTSECTRHLGVMGHFGDESFQTIECTGTDNQTTTK